MKNWKHYGIVCLLAFVVLAFISCKEDDPPEIIREFNDIIFLGKNIKLIDETRNEKNLKERGIWHKIQDGLDSQTINPEGNWKKKFEAIYETGNFAIIITNGLDFEDGYSFIEYNILFRENQLFGFSAEDIGGAIYFSIQNDMNILY